MISQPTSPGILERRVVIGTGVAILRKFLGGVAEYDSVVRSSFCVACHFATFAGVIQRIWFSNGARRSRGCDGWRAH
jgi:hypothetical protein